MNIVYLLLGGLVGYLFGAIPFGFIFVKMVRGIDLRRVKSGRTGGTNAMRAAGPIVGGLTAVSDVLKGAAAIWLARALFGGVVSAEWLPWIEIAVGVMAIVGHNWSVFLGWGGGAGTGPNVGWAAAVWLPVAPIAAVVVGGLILGVGMASIASLAMAALIPLTFGILYAFTDIIQTPAYMVGGILTGLVVTWALRPNIRRLLDGTERVVGPVAKRRKKRQKRRKEKKQAQHKIRMKEARQEAQ